MTANREPRGRWIRVRRRSRNRSCCRSRNAASSDRTTQGCSWSPEKRSEEHTSELQSLMRISYAVFCLKKKKKQKTTTNDTTSVTYQQTTKKDLNKHKTK